jgi:hypothetical protein
MNFGTLASLILIALAKIVIGFDNIWKRWMREKIEDLGSDSNL